MHAIFYFLSYLFFIPYNLLPILPSSSSSARLKCSISVPCELRPLLPVGLGGNDERFHERHRFAVALGYVFYEDLHSATKMEVGGNEGSSVSLPGLGHVYFLPVRPDFGEVTEREPHSRGENSDGGVQLQGVELRAVPARE